MNLTSLAVRIGGASLACYSIFQAYRAVSIGTVKAFGNSTSVAFVDSPGGFAFWLVGWLFGIVAGIFLVGYSKWLSGR